VRWVLYINNGKNVEKHNHYLIDIPNQPPQISAATLIMKYTTTSLSLLGLAAAASIPAPRDIVRVLPRGWSFNITALSGPGCPDFGKDPNAARTTRLTFGQNTMDGSEIYYWFGAYPWMRVNLEKGEDSTWCETEISYFEYSNYTNEVPSEDYRLRLHKNGTREIATYDLEEGVKATFDFSYKVAGKKVC
jgi:hypothetical protein